MHANGTRGGNANCCKSQMPTVLAYEQSCDDPGENFIVYDKSSSPLSGTVRLDNVGRESHTYLKHIVSRYESGLADWTVFTQAAEPSFGYKGHRSGGGHLNGGVGFRDYLTPRAEGTSFLVHTAAVTLPDLASSLRMSYVFDDPALHQTSACPPDGAEWSAWWDMGWFKSYVEDKAKEQGGPSALEFYQRLVAPEAPKTSTVQLAFAQGARFGVSRAAILARPKAYYEQLLAAVSTHSDPYAGYYLEWMWPTVFGASAPPTPACALPADAERPLSHPISCLNLIF